VSIIVGHWGDEDCMAKAKDVVVPTITPVQHDYPRLVPNSTRGGCLSPLDPPPPRPAPAPSGFRYVHGRDNVHSLQRSMRTAAAAGLGRNGPLLFFAGGITSFGASQVGWGASRATQWPLCYSQTLVASRERLRAHPSHPSNPGLTPRRPCQLHAWSTPGPRIAFALSPLHPPPGVTPGQLPSEWRRH